MLNEILNGVKTVLSAPVDVVCGTAKVVYGGVESIFSEEDPENVTGFERVKEGARQIVDGVAEPITGTCEITEGILDIPNALCGADEDSKEVLQKVVYHTTEIPKTIPRTIESGTESITNYIKY